MKEFYLKNLLLHNYRRFEDLEIELNPQMNVLIGKNAAGKTTILEAVNVMLGAYLSAYKKYVSSQYVWNISETDILQKTMQQGSQNALVAPTIPQFPCKVGCSMNWDGKEIEYQRIVEKDGGRTKFDGKNPMQPRVTKWEKAIASADGTDLEEIYPLVLYLSSARLWNENKNGEFTQIPNRMEAYKRCLDDKRGSQSAFAYIQLLANISAEERDGKPLPVYDAIMEAVQYSMGEELSEKRSVLYSSRYKEIAVKNEDGTVIRFASLSDGYRNIIKIVTDIATKMCILNPQLEKDVLKLTPGIVVIDELDLSLHPTWQKRIVRILKTLFPKVQFICATHSPFIVQSLGAGELIPLDDIQGDKYSGESIEDIAEDFMQVSTPQYSERKEKMYKAAEEYFAALERSTSAAEIQELKGKMDVLSAEYSDNPAYCALIQQKYLEKKIKVEA